MPHVSGLELGLVTDTYTPPFTIDPDLYNRMLLDSSRLVNQPGVLVQGPVVDVGAGNGRNTIPLALRGYNVTAIDPELQIPIKHSNITELRCDVREIEFPTTANFLCVYAIRFMKKPDALSVIDRMMGATIPNGRHIYEELLPLYPPTSETMHDPECWFNPDDIQRIYTAAGWTVTQSVRLIPTVYRDEEGQQVWSRSARVFACNTASEKRG